MSENPEPEGLLWRPAMVLHDHDLNCPYPGAQRVENDGCSLKPRRIDVETQLTCQWIHEVIVAEEGNTCHALHIIALGVLESSTSRKDAEWRHAASLENGDPYSLAL
jgi:hypothetical protein